MSVCAACISRKDPKITLRKHLYNSTPNSGVVVAPYWEDTPVENPRTLPGKHPKLTWPHTGRFPVEVESIKYGFNFRRRKDIEIKSTEF